MKAHQQKSSPKTKVSFLNKLFSKGPSTNTIIPFTNKPHHYLTKKSKSYRNWHQNQYSKPVHRATLVAFISSFLIFTLLQFTFPTLFTPQGALASSLQKVWTTLTDFTTTTSSNTDLTTSSGEVKITNSSASQTQNTTAQFNTE